MSPITRYISTSPVANRPEYANLCPFARRGTRIPVNSSSLPCRIKAGFGQNRQYRQNRQESPESLVLPLSEKATGSTESKGDYGAFWRLFDGINGIKVELMWN